MAGLVPAIHVCAFRKPKKDVDARHEAGHDGACASMRASLIQCYRRRYILMPFSEKYFTAPGCHGTGELPVT